MQEGVAKETQKKKMLPKMPFFSDSGTHSNVTETSVRSLTMSRFLAHGVIM